MELIAKLSQEDKQDIAVMVAEYLKPFLGAKTEQEKPLETAEIMKLLGIKAHVTFRKAVKEFKAKPVAKIANRKYYLPSQFKM